MRTNTLLHHSYATVFDGFRMSPDHTAAEVQKLMFLNRGVKADIRVNF